MSDLGALNGLLMAAEVAAASLVLPPSGWLLARTYPRRAAARRLVWAMVFAVLLALPVLAVALPSAAVIAVPAPPPMQPDVAPVAAMAPPAPAPAGFDGSVLIPLALAVWLAGLVKFGGQHLLTLVRLELMRRAAEPWPKAPPVRVRGCELKMSEDCPGPITWGALRPVILLPDEALEWSDAKLETVLRHELAHVRRRDGLVQAMAATACALYWINPLVWLAARALRREAELAADDAVIAAGVRPSDYAGQLLDLAAQWRERRLTPTGLVAMASPPALSQRVQSILSTEAIRTGATAMDISKLVLLGGAATAALTLARPSLAEIPAPPPSPPEVQTAPPAPAQTPAIASGPAPAKAQVRAPRTASAAEIQLAQQDVPALPEVTAAPLPPLPPAPSAAPPPSIPPAPGAAPWTQTWIPNPNGAPSPPVVFGRRMTPEQRAELDRQLAAIGPAIDKAIKDAHIDETVQKALAAEDAKTREEVAQQLQQIGPRIQQAIANAHIRELVAQRMAEIQPQIEEAMKKARERSAEIEDRTAAQLEEQAKRARERAQRDREQLNAAPSTTTQPPKD